MNEKIQSKHEVQNIITQVQYGIDKGRKDLSDHKKQLKELIQIKLIRLEAKLKEKRRKRNMKKFLGILSFTVLLILFVIGLLFVI